MASSTIRLPPDFVKSYQQHSTFPRNVASNTDYESALIAYRERLDKHATRLFIDPEDESFVIPFRDIRKNANGEWVIMKSNALNDQKLRLKLGDTTEKDPIKGALATLPDPTCRFIFVVSESALEPLYITQDSLLRILTYHQVMPAYIDFLLVYGTRNGDRELRFTGFRTRTTLQNPVPSCIIADLQRTGRQHEVCYNLKAVSKKYHSGKLQSPRNPWKIRQAAIYHRFDLGSGAGLWIIGDPKETVKNDLKDVLPEGPVPKKFNFGTVSDAFTASLDTHLVLVNWASASWRWHIQALEEDIDYMTGHPVLFSKESFDQPPLALNLATYSRVQEYEDKVNEILMVIEANLKIFSSLLTSYTVLVEDKNFPITEQNACKTALELFSTKLEEYSNDLRMQADRARVVSKVATDRKSIVLQRLQAQTTTKQEALSYHTQKDTIAMRIITIITLLYLPPTFVCTFFGTDVIKYQDDGQGQVFFSVQAMRSFLYVTIPLWFITIAGVYALNKMEEKKRNVSYPMDRIHPVS